jgi:hypothetical protein
MKAMIRRIKMAVSHWTEADSKRAEEIWAEYQQQHDVSGKVGQTAGIDPVSARVWFGDSMQDVVAQQDADGNAAPLFCNRSRRTLQRGYCAREQDGLRRGA